MESVQATNKNPSQTKRILAYLKARGKHGVYNYEFAQQRILRAPSRVNELRKKGHVINCSRISSGIYKYTLMPEAEYDESL